MADPQPTSLPPPLTFWEFMIRRGDFFFGGGVIGIVFILVLPLPPILIDILLSLSIALSVTIILNIAFLRDPTEFFVFPTVLLFVTLFRLGMNIATTRAILTSGDAGLIIQTFGNFVVQGNLVVGLIIFIILTIINFVVITKGAGRVAEVAARFTLDAMPGKQMSIDADLNAGIISEKDARERRRSLEREASFYGAMDGASKFVRGDAIAGILITAINLVGGFAVGKLQMGLSAEEAMRKFSLLSVGDGLVAQIPALLVSTGAGILVTRSSSSTGLGQDVARQLLGNQRTMLGTGLLMFGLMLIPGFPHGVLFVLGLMFMALTYLMPKASEQPVAGGAEAGKEDGGKGKGDKSKKPGAAAGVPEGAVKKADPLSLELGLGLLPLIHNNMENMLERLAAVRRGLSFDLGVVIPPIAVKDNPGLTPHHYRLMMRGHEVTVGELFPGQMLAMGVGTTQRPLRGRVTTEPAFGLPATWIPDIERREAERMGYAVIDPLSVLITHINETLKNNASDLLTRQDVQRMLDALKESDPAVLAEMTGLQLSLGTVHRVLQNLLREGISVREFSSILEKLCDQIAYTKNPDELSEAVRKALVLEIGRGFELINGKLMAITMHPEIEQHLAKCIRQTAQEIALVMDPGLARHVHDQLTQGIQAMAHEGKNGLLVCSPVIRLGLRRFFSDTFPMLRVVAYNEIAPKIALQPVFNIGAMSMQTT